MRKSLHIIMYHYVRDLPNTLFPRLKGMMTGDFRRQVSALLERYEMAPLEAALDFLRGDYSPRRDLCLLTFDDGLKEHYTDVTPILAQHGIQGLFFPISSCLDSRRVDPTHMNHFLMAALEFSEYRDAFMHRLQSLAPDSKKLADVDSDVARRVYRWDVPEIAAFKYLCNFLLDPCARDRVLESLFEEKISPIDSFAASLYLTWDEARQMQAAGMLLGGHSHRHRALATLPEVQLESDLTRCWRLLRKNLSPQYFWPFCYPFGKRNSFGAASVTLLKRLGFSCALSTEVGANSPLDDPFVLQRIDCKDFAYTKKRSGFFSLGHGPAGIFVGDELALDQCLQFFFELVAGLEFALH